MASQTQTLFKAEKNALILQGVIAITFGVAAVFWPDITTRSLLYLLAAFLVVDAIVAMVLGLLGIRNVGRSVLYVLIGLVELGVGMYFFQNPAVEFELLILIIGFAFIIRGLFNFVHAFTQLTGMLTRVLHAILGILGVVVGIVVLWWPVESGIGFVWLLGVYALIAGFMMIAMAADLQRTMRLTSSKVATKKPKTTTRRTSKKKK